MIQRKKPLRRGGPIKRTSRPRQRSARRLSEIRLYARDAAYYLANHRYCQIFIARHELDEEKVARGLGTAHVGGKLLVVPFATEIHHRNKRNGERLLDQRWWMAACREQHDWVENNKTDARALGFLLPIQANENGEWGSGQRALPTPEFMVSKVRR